MVASTPGRTFRRSALVVTQVFAAPGKALTLIDLSRVESGRVSGSGGSVNASVCSWGWWLRSGDGTICQRFLTLLGSSRACNVKSSAKVSMASMVVPAGVWAGEGEISGRLQIEKECVVERVACGCQKRRAAEIVSMCVQALTDQQLHPELVLASPGPDCLGAGFTFAC